MLVFVEGQKNKNKKTKKQKTKKQRAQRKGEKEHVDAGMPSSEFEPRLRC